MGKDTRTVCETGQRENLSVLENNCFYSDKNNRAPHFCLGDLSSQCLTFLWVGNIYQDASYLNQPCYHTDAHYALINSIAHN